MYTLINFQILYFYECILVHVLCLFESQTSCCNLNTLTNNVFTAWILPLYDAICWGRWKVRRSMNGQRPRGAGRRNDKGQSNRPWHRPNARSVHPASCDGHYLGELFHQITMRFVAQTGKTWVVYKLLQCLITGEVKDPTQGVNV